MSEGSALSKRVFPKESRLQLPSKSYAHESFCPCCRQSVSGRMRLGEWSVLACTVLTDVRLHVSD